LGEVCQIIHLPILAALAERFEIAAICDISKQLLEVIGEKYRVKQRYEDALKLVEQSDLDAVFVLNSDEYHTEVAIAAANQKQHVFIEKPMCLTMAEADGIIAARDAAGVQVMVGYMRRYAPAFIQAVEEVKTCYPINYVKIRDIIGPNRLFTDQTSSVYRFTDIPAEAAQDKTRRAEKLITEAIGDVPPRLKEVYRLLSSLSSHDFSAMRELIGMPKRVVAASQWKNGLYCCAIFEYDGFHAVFETGIDQQRRFDANIEVYSDTKSVKIQYDTPYIRQLPVKLQIEETIAGAFQETTIRPSYEDAYTCELKYFYDVVTQGLKPKTSPEDYKEDLQMFKMIIEALSSDT
jgi:predicted dehydrogenase